VSSGGDSGDFHSAIASRDAAAAGGSRAESPRAVAARRPAAPSSLRQLLPWLVAWRLLFLSLPAVFAALHLAPFSEAAYFANFHGAVATPPTFATRWATWDAQHYLFLAQHDYIAGHVSSAFWPLWPLIIRAASRLTTAPELGSALVLANLLAILAAVGLWRLIVARSDRQTAGWTVLLLLVFPSAFFLGLPYSEALFLALSVGFFLALDGGRYGWATGAAIALPLARPVGVLILLPLAVYLRKAEMRSALARPTRACLLLAPLAGAAAYFGFHLVATGQPLGAFGVRGVFASGQSLLRTFDLAGFLRAFSAVDSLHSVTRSLLDRLLFLLALGALPWLYRRDRVLFWYVVPMALVPALSLRFMAFSRFALVLFPVFWAGSELLLAQRRAALRWAIVALSLALQIWLYFRHTLNLWAG